MQLVVWLQLKLYFMQLETLVRKRRFGPSTKKLILTFLMSSHRSKWWLNQYRNPTTQSVWKHPTPNGDAISCLVVVEIIFHAIRNFSQEEDVRSFYKETYIDIFDEFPSVKMMVKSALKTDLSCNNTNGASVDRTYSNSAIWNRYSDGVRICVCCTQILRYEIDTVME